MKQSVKCCCTTSNVSVTGELCASLTLLSVCDSFAVSTLTILCVYLCVASCRYFTNIRNGSSRRTPYKVVQTESSVLGNSDDDDDDDDMITIWLLYKLGNLQ